MQIQFTRTQLIAFLCIVLVGDLVLVTTLVSTQVSPVMGAIVVGAGLGIPVLIFTFLVPAAAGALGWFSLRRLYPGTGLAVFRGDVPMISMGIGRSWMGLNNVIEAYADDDHLHMRILAPIPRTRMPVSIPWAAVVSIDPHGKFRSKVMLESGPRLFLPVHLTRNEVALRASLDQETAA